MPEAAYIYIMNGTVREHLKPGMKVNIVLKKDQRTGILTEGIIKAILTKSPQHPHGIKVLLESGAVGRVKEIVQ
ncbi:MAG TPA: YwbE family protein [Chryseolinea sp.]|nr:YwbE family protein [Chryseolinea sp.]